MRAIKDEVADQVLAVLGENAQPMTLDEIALCIHIEESINKSISSEEIYSPHKQYQVGERLFHPESMYQSWFTILGFTKGWNLKVVFDNGEREIFQQAAAADKSFEFGWEFEKKQIITNILETHSSILGSDGEYIAPLKDSHPILPEHGRAREKIISQAIENINQVVKLYQFEQADEYYNRISSFYPRHQYNELIREARKRKLKEDAIADLKKLLSKYEFVSADSAFVQSGILDIHTYEQIKSTYIRKYFQERQNFAVNEEQSVALSGMGKSILIRARAGSGKTRVLACKTNLLIQGYSVNPDHILILAFNRKAATEIGNRIRKHLGDENFENARTFHSLAYQIVIPQKQLLFDEGQHDLDQRKLSTFVQDVMRGIWTPEIEEKIFELFRREMRSIVSTGALLDDADYIAYIRSQRDITLAGDRVKSKGEKIIADFLFEHDIPYIYERVEYWSGHNYRPDFVLYEHDVVIEFWGIDEKDNKKQIPSWWDITWDQYHQQMQEKRKYWRKEGKPLVELSVADLKSGRAQFETGLKKILESEGIPCNKISQKKLEKKVIRIQVDRMTRLFVQFIQKAKKRMLNPEDIKEKMTEYQFGDERERMFVGLATRIYHEFQKELAQKNSMDFDDLMLHAAEMIASEGDACGIDLGIHKDRRLRLKDLKYILIDEYQDFSLLFFNLVNNIRKINSGVNLICVGDDWQAINKFAGSDLKFFNQAGQHFQDLKTFQLITNYRSQERIVDSGNRLMRDLGMPGKVLPGNNGGGIDAYQIDQVWIERREDDEFADQRNQDDRFVFTEARAESEKIIDNGYLQAKYLKACNQIITLPENLQLIAEKRDSKQDDIRVAILSRTNWLYRVSIYTFLQKLRASLSRDERRAIGKVDQKIRVSTIHSFKGMEADIVIILKTCEGTFPLIHPDSSLYGIFGEDEQSQLDEERRLYYVAVTRAKEKLYFLTEKDRESVYLHQIGVPIRPWPYRKKETSKRN
jgi:DNA helicase IV